MQNQSDFLALDQRIKRKLHLCSVGPRRHFWWGALKATMIGVSDDETVTYKINHRFCYKHGYLAEAGYGPFDHAESLLSDDNGTGGYL